MAPRYFFGSRVAAARAAYAPAMEKEAPVLIAGGGMVGLAAATFLAQQGIRSVAIERLKESSPLPRAAFFHMRTLEMFRSLGIEDRVREQSAKDFVPEGALIAMDCVSGRKLADIIPNLNEGVEAVSPCRRLFLNQPSLEPILRERAREAGATVLQGAEITDVRQDATASRSPCVTSTAATSASCAASYLIAADGGHSKVRELLGIGYEGRGVVLELAHHLFHRGPVAVDPRQRVEHHLREQPGARRVLPHEPRRHRGLPRRQHRRRSEGRSAGRANVAADLSEAALIELIRAGVGRAGPRRAHRWLHALARHRGRRADDSRTAASSSPATPRT